VEGSQNDQSRAGLLGGIDVSANGAITCGNDVTTPIAMNSPTWYDYQVSSSLSRSSIVSTPIAQDCRTMVSAALAIVLLSAVVSGCDDDDPISPPGTSSYLIDAIATVDVSESYAVVTRKDGRAPSALDVAVRLDGEAMAVDPRWSSADESVFRLDFGSGSGGTHSVEVVLGEITASGVLALPGSAATLEVTSPPPDSLIFVPGQPLVFRWEYAGNAPTLFNFLAIAFTGGSFPHVHHMTVDDSLRTAEIPASVTSTWSSAQQALVTIEARVLGPISGDLAMDGSRTVVKLAAETIAVSRP
jgi:hypothetical protein